MSVLQWIRESDPATFKDVPDEELTRFAVDWDPGLLEADPDLAARYAALKAKTPSLQAVGLEMGRLPGQTTVDAMDAAAAADQAANAEKRQGMRVESAAARTAGARADAAANVIGAVSDYGVFPVSPQGMAQAVRNIGQIARGLAVDTMSGKVMPRPGRLLPELDATASAVGAAPGQPLPGEENLTNVQRGVADAAQSLPTIAGAMALSRLGMPAPLAFGAASASQTAAETGDPVAALRSGTIGALIPGTANLGRTVAAKVLNRAVAKGLVGAESATFQKLIEAGFAQGAVQGIMEASNLPNYAAMTPAERREAITRSLVANMAFVALDVPVVAGRGPSVTQQHMQSRIRLAEWAGREVGEMLKDPAFARMMDTAVEMQAIAPETARPQSRTQTVESPKPTRKAANEEEGMQEGKPQGNEVAYPAWETEGGMPGTGERESAAVDFPYSNDNAGSEPAATTELLPDNRSVVAVEFPANKIEVDQKLIPQFKEDADPSTGEVRGEELRAAKYERPSNPIVVWQLNDGRNVVVTGRHRLALAKRLGETTIPTTVVREAEGFTRDMAMALDAEFNIRDGNGSVRDYAGYFEAKPDLTEAEARQRGLLDRAKGRAAWHLARSASDDLKTLYRAGRISEGKAVAVAAAAPGNDAVQRLGMRYADRPEDFIVNMMRAALAESGGRTEALDLFGSDDSAIRQMEEQAKRASSFQKQLRDQVAAVQGAAKRPEVAKQKGVDVSDPNAVLQRISELKAEIERWNNWPMHPDLVAMTKGNAKPTPPSQPGPPSADFSLERLTEDQLKAERAASEAKAKAAAAQDAMAAKAAAPLVGDSSDVGQARLFSADTDLFSGPSAESSGTVKTFGEGSSGGSRRVAASSQGKVVAGRRPFYTPETTPSTAAVAPPPTLGGVDLIRPAAFPELVRLAHTLTGDWTKLKRFPGALGMFYAAGKGAIKLNPVLFKDVQQAARTLAHEIGHLDDYLPDRTMDRGNLLGRIATLKNWLKTTIPLDPKRSLDEVLEPKERQALRRKAEQEVGTRPPQDEPGDLARWQELVKERYAELRDEAIRSKGLVAEPWIREELLGITRWWKPYDPIQLSPSKLAYRESSAELYADAISVLFNAPAELQTRAPQFWKTFFAYLERKPEVKATFLELQTLLAQGPQAVARQRIAAAKAGYEKAEQMFLFKLREQEEARNTFRGFWRKLQHQHVDVGSALLSAADELRRRGMDIPTTVDARLAWEEGLFGDNQTFRDLRKLFEEALLPLEAAGIDTATLGNVLEFQREMGNRTAQQQLADIATRLGNEKMALIESAGEVLTKLEKQPNAEDLILKRVIAPIEAAGLSFEDVIAVRDLKLQQGSRAEIANPLGNQPQFAEENLKVLLNDLGPDNAKLVTAAASKIRGLFFSRMREAHQVGIVSDAAMKVVEANRDSYAAFRALDHIEPWVSPMVKRAYGHLGEIENPLITTLLKLTSLNRLIVEQKAKIATRDLFLQHFPESFVKAETYWDGRGWAARKAANGLTQMNVLENGRPVAYDVDPYIADAFQKLPSSQLNVGMAALDLVFRRGIYPLIIKYNPGFQYALNPIRDYKRSSRNIAALYKVGRTEYLKRYIKAWGSAKSWAKGQPDAVMDAMMEASAIGTPIDTFSNLDRTDALGEIMRRYRLLPEHRGGVAKSILNTVTKPAMAILDHIEKAGVIREALPKVAAWQALMDRGVSPREAGWAIRNYIGTPNFRLKGKHGNFTNTLVPFSNIFIQGYRSDLALATKPRTRGGWWLRWAMGDGSRTMVQALAASGVLGGVLKGLYDGVSEYDLTNYLVIPVGWQAGGEMGRKIVYVRIPRDETSRALSAVMYKAVRAMFDPDARRKFPSEIFGFGAGMVPSPSPVLEIAGAWNDYLSGQNPVDSFHNSPIVPPTEFEAGPRHSLGPMLAWTANQLGVMNFVSYNKDSNSTLELVTSAIPGLNRLLKTSDAGYRGKQYETLDDERRTEAISKLAWSPEVRSLLHEYYRLQRLGRNRTPQQTTRWAQLIAWKTVYDAYDAGVEASEMSKDSAGAASLRKALHEQTLRDMDVWKSMDRPGSLHAPWAAE